MVIRNCIFFVPESPSVTVTEGVIVTSGSLLPPSANNSTDKRVRKSNVKSIYLAFKLFKRYLSIDIFLIIV